MKERIIEGAIKWNKSKKKRNEETEREDTKEKRISKCEI
jgi:hypothetical protein